MQQIAGLLSTIGSIWVLIKLFQKKGVLHGILGIISFGIYPFIWGLIHFKEEDIKKPMIIWLIAIAISFILFFVGNGSAAPAAESFLLLFA